MSSGAAPERLFTAPFLLCSAANLAQGLAFNLFLHFPGFLDELGASAVQIGFIVGITGVAAIAARPPIGRSMDTRGRRGVIRVGGVLHVAACAGYLLLSGLGPFVYALRIVHGVAEAMLFTALFTYAADQVPAARRTQGLALFGVSGMLPISLAGLLGDAILAQADYAALFGAALAAAVVSLALSLPLRDRPRDRTGEEPAEGFRAALRQRDLLPLWWIGGIFSLALASVFTFIKLFVEKNGLGTVGAFFSAYTAAALFLRVFLGWLPDRVGPKRVLFPALASLALALVLLGAARGPGEVLAAGLLIGVGHGFTFPILFGLLVTRVRASDRGSAMAIFTALFDLGVVLGGPTFGLVVTRAGYGTMYVVAGLTVAAGTLAFAIWDPRAQRAR